MNDMTQVIAPKSDQLNADDLISGPRTITITGAKVTPGDQPVSLRFEGDDGKPYKPCKTMSKLLAYAWGPSSKEFVGKSLTLYRDPKVKWGGLEVGGIRISHMSHIERDFVIALTETRGVKKPISVKKLVLGQGDQQQRKQADPDAAQKWVDDHLGFVAGAMTIERLDEVKELGRKAMLKLAGTDLHAVVTAAYAARLADITADDEPFAEGRTDEQHGDPFDGAEIDA